MKVLNLVLGFALTLSAASTLASADSTSPSTKPTPTLFLDCSNSSVSSAEASDSAGLAMVGGGLVQQNLMVLEPHVQTFQAYNPLKVTIWSVKSTIELKFGYSIVLDASFQKKAVVGDFIIDRPELEVAGLLLFKGKPVSSGSTEATTKQTLLSKKQGYAINMTLDNTPLRAALGAGTAQETQFSESTVDQQNALVTSFGDGSGVVSAVTIECEVLVK